MFSKQYLSFILSLCFNLLNDGHDAFVNMSWEGFPSNKEVIMNLDSLLENKAKELTNEIYNIPEVCKYIKKKGYNYNIEGINSSKERFKKIKLNNTKENTITIKKLKRKIDVRFK